jgi:Na+/melibiose symporter-like transporter
MIGVLFTMPQYFQGVLGTNAMGSGLRLLPLIGGLTVGAVPASQVARLVGAKVAVALGFAVLATGLILGNATSPSSGGAWVAAWMAVTGLGMGLAMATSASAALSELSEERAGVGSAVLQALNKVGGPLGTAVLGSVLSSAYLARLDLSGLAAPAAAAVRQSVFGGVAVARQLGSATLLQGVRAAFVHGMDVALTVSAGVAVAGAVLALIFLPRSAVADEHRHERREEEATVVAR